MADLLQSIIESGPGKVVAKRVGVPEATELRRWEPGQPLLDGPALLLGEGRLRGEVDRVLRAAGAAVLETPPPGEGERLGAVVLDASGITSVDGLRELYEGFGPVLRSIGASGRALVLGTPPAAVEDVEEAVAQRALEGFTRSLGKELRKGATAQLVLVKPGAEDRIESTLRFLLSSKSAYVDGQVVQVDGGDATDPADWERPLDGQVAVVTGASRGIGEAIAEVLARDGAHVVCVDVPAQGEALTKVANRIGGSALQLDVTADDAGQTLAEHAKERHGGVDVVVHNAGITRDRTLGRMSDDEWDVLMAVNLAAPVRITDTLLDTGALNEGARVVCVSSVNGIAGQRGQANYATSKAGLIGLVQAQSPKLAPSRTINAVAPGFIETQMTAAMPLFTREAGRRLNSLNQGGQPVDVAETIAWLSSPASGGVTGQVVRVCGQMLLGA
ncbi:3-oxoacyl-ACP reductase [Conexibacter sp. SYSU D00693]|uniref:3-oxoacyl-ACP reductase n=1 Tax=Conexibacter sp. SYSU D00693 TaxID=2812560 RepID=UPI00196B7E09|nr:3-oxoacyl-ACP reductase [Conexibacter sp. SYSU D00693]